MKKVYLCGGINGLSDAACKDWREEVKAKLAGAYFLLDPMRRDYRGIEAESVDAIVAGDLEDIQASDVILAMADTPSWGTGMEIFYASSIGKTVLSICSKERPSPWLVKHSAKMFLTLDAALLHLLDTK